MAQDAETRLKALFIGELDGDQNAYRSFLQALTRICAGICENAFHFVPMTSKTSSRKSYWRFITRVTPIVRMSR